MKDKITINIAKDFSDSVGARDKKDGKFSGEEFYEKHLKPKFEKSQKEGKKLFIDFDNSWGYPSSFISSAFGRLSDDFGKNVLDHIEIKSDDDKMLKGEIEIAIEEGNQ